MTIGHHLLEAGRRPQPERQDVVNSYRPTDGSFDSARIPSSVRWTLALWLAAVILAASAPTAFSKSSAKAHGAGAVAAGDRVVPGQEKKAIPIEASAGETKGAKPSKPSRSPNAAGRSQSSKPPKSSKSTSAQSGSAQPDDGASPVASAPVAERASATPGLSAVHSAPAVQLVSARGQDISEPSSERPRSARRSRRTEPASPASVATNGSALAARTVAVTATAPARARAAARPDPSGSPLTRTVVRVLEVVPVQMRIALALLACLGLLFGGATAVQTIRRRRLENQRRLLLADVGVLQSALLPDLPGRIGGARVSAAYRPAEGLAAGGDFYDAFELPGGRTAVLVGDIAGHGRDVVPLTALVRYSLRAYVEAGLSPRATLNVASNVLAPQLGGRQVTIALAIFDPGTGRLTYACAGHWPPLLLGGSAPPVTACSSPAIGAGAPTGRRQTTIPLAPGAGACFHTDGLDEVPTGSGRLGRDGVAAELQAVGPHGDAADLLARIVRRSETQPDDMAACILTALPGAAAGWSLRLEELEVDAAALSGGWAERFLLACGVSRPRVTKALREARQIIARAGTAVIEVRSGEALSDVRVGLPPAVTLPIARRPAHSIDLTATG